MRHEALVNPDLLVWARESINMDLEEAAHKLRVPLERLSAWETGTLKPTINQARKMSEIYRRPLAAFYLSQRPSDLGFSVPHDFRRLHDTQPAEPSTALVSELRRIEYLRSAAIHLAEEHSLQRRTFAGQTRFDEPIRAVADRAIALLQLPVAARTAWHNQFDAFNGWRSAIERHGVLVMHINKVEVREVRGIAIAEPVFPLIAVNGKDSPYGRIFSLLHEFVHLMLGVTGMSNLRISSQPQDHEQRIERFCNYVAGEVLVPRRDLLSHVHVQDVRRAIEWSDEILEDLSQTFHVSRETVLRRLLILGRTTADFYRLKRRQYAKEYKRPKGGRVPVAKRIIRAIGQPFGRLVLDAYYREAISGSEVAELLGAKLIHLRAVEDLLVGRNAAAGGER